MIIAPSGRFTGCIAYEGDMTQSFKEVSEDHILMATDYPHFDGVGNSRTHGSYRQRDG